MNANPPSRRLATASSSDWLAAFTSVWRWAWDPSARASPTWLAASPITGDSSESCTSHGEFAGWTRVSLSQSGLAYGVQGRFNCRRGPMIFLHSP